MKMAMAASEAAKQKNLSLVNGLCWRYDLGVREGVKRVLDGQIGEIIAIQEHYLRGPYGLRERKPEWNEMQYQFQNWYHFNWLSGDDFAQSLIHNISVTSWVVGDVAPVQAWGMGGRQICVEPKYGDAFDHQAVVYEYANGVRIFGYCRDIPGCYSETADVILGTKGRALHARQAPDRRRKALALPRPHAQHVRRRAPGAVRRHPRRQAAQQRQVHVHVHAARNPRPDGLLHGPVDHVGAGS